MNLSFRLQSLRNKYRNESSVWDVGCDHGLLGLSFLDQESVKEIHLVDPSLSVIEELNKKLDSYITKGKVFIHHCKGQDLTLSNKAPLIYIAGMGGKEIREILQSLSSQLTYPSRVVISPHRNILELRSFLHSSQYRLEAEEVLRDGEQFYQVLCLSLDESGPRVSLYGSELWKDDIGRAYKDHQLSFFRAHRDELSREYCRFLEGLSS